MSYSLVYDDKRGIEIIYTGENGSYAVNFGDTHDNVNHPKHYTSSQAKCQNCGHPIEYIDVAEHLPCCLANAIKYIWRLDFKDNPIEDLDKAIWYLNREKERRLKSVGKN